MRFWRSVGSLRVVRLLRDEVIEDGYFYNCPTCYYSSFFHRGFGCDKIWDGEERECPVYKKEIESGSFENVGLEGVSSRFNLL